MRTGGCCGAWQRKRCIASAFALLNFHNASSHQFEASFHHMPHFLCSFAKFVLLCSINRGLLLSFSRERKCSSLICEHCVFQFNSSSRKKLRLWMKKGYSTSSSRTLSADTFQAFRSIYPHLWETHLQTPCNNINARNYSTDRCCQFLRRTRFFHTKVTKSSTDDVLSSHGLREAFFLFPWRLIP